MINKRDPQETFAKQRPDPAYQREQTRIAAKTAEILAAYGAASDAPRAERIAAGIKAFNAFEEEQEKILKGLYLDMAQGKGHKFLRPIWDGNSFQVNGRLDLRIDELAHKLVVFLGEFNPGAD